MNIAVKLGIKALSKMSPKTKIAIGVTIASLLLIMPIVMGVAAIAPFAATIQMIDTLQKKAANFFEGTGEKFVDFFQRGFVTVDEEKVKEQEGLVYEKMKAEYEKFSNYVQLDVPLVAATIFYPMNFIYDEGAIEDLNSMDGKTEEQLTAEQAEADEKLYDYYKKVRRDGGYIDKLANNSISEIVTTYECETKTFTAGDGTETTYYVVGAQSSSTGPQKFEGDFKDNEVCTEKTDSIQTYSYQNDQARYDAYLKDEHLLTNAAYDPYFKGLEGAEKVEKLNTVVNEIKDLKGLYADLIGSNQIAGRYSSVCSSGVMVSGENAGVYNFEDYVAGVVTNENNWYEGVNIEAMKAQAIAARTYLLKRTNNCAYPIENSTGAQTFNPNPSAKARQAANETAGMVLTYNGEIFSSEYDSFYCTELPLGCPIDGMCTCDYTMEPGGEVHAVSVSANFAKSGIGGHGRGMSQVAARYLQTLGYGYKQILEYFYSPGVQIVTTGESENGIDGIVVVQNGVFMVPANMDSGLSGSRGSGPGGFNIYFWQRLDSFFKAAATAGYDIDDYTDSWRSYEAQVRCEKEKPDLCATPGKSLHGWGIAADLNFKGNKAAQDWAHANAGNYSLDFAVCADYFGGVCKEPWHIQPSEIAYK